MKILITVDPEIPVPPTNYGGIERIVSSLSEEFTKQGHEVYLQSPFVFASSYCTHDPNSQACLQSEHALSYWPL